MLYEVITHLLPRIADGVPNHRCDNTIGVGGVAPGEAALDTRVALVGTAVLVRHHPDQFVAAQFSLERAANPAVGAGCQHTSGRDPEFDDRLLRQGRRRAGLHAP